MTTSTAPRAGRGSGRTGERGQVIVIFGLALVGIVGMIALILEGGNAYAQQRIVQNAADAAANAGAVVLSERLAGAPHDDAAVAAAVGAVADANRLESRTGRYTDVNGRFLNATGATVAGADAAAAVGGGTIPPRAQGVHLAGTRTFPTAVGRAIGINSFDASAEATAVAGTLAGGEFMPIVLPVNIVDCGAVGDLGTGEAKWNLSQPDDDDPDGDPEGQKYVIPLCKTAEGSLQILDLDPTLKCSEESLTGVLVSWPVLPVQVPSDNGNDCAKHIAEAVNANFRGKTVLIPVCEVDCVTSGGSKAAYTVVKVAAFHVDYMEHSNNPNNSACQGNGTTLVTVAGNGSSSCLVGWFVRYISAGPVGTGSVGHADAIGIQLIK